MEASAVRQRSSLRAAAPLLRLQGDDRLVARTRRGSPAAYEALVARYRPRLREFCRHILGSAEDAEDAEDVLEGVFASALSAVLADDRPIDVRPWLYRIARNGCLDHLRRRKVASGPAIDVDGGEGLCELARDVQALPECQRTALLLRESGALSHEQIAEAMETTLPVVKGLLVHARVSLAEAAEARASAGASVARATPDP